MILDDLILLIIKCQCAIDCITVLYNKDQNIAKMLKLYTNDDLNT